MKRIYIVSTLLLVFLAGVGGAHACFGKMLKVGVPSGRESALAAYALGWFAAEKTGIEPEFVAVEDPLVALSKREIDIAVAPSSAPVGPGLVVREGGIVPGVGPARFYLRSDVLEDLRFFTVDKALGLAPAFFGSPAYGAAVSSGADAKKAARKAVNDGT